MSEVSVFADVDPSQWIASNEAAFAIRDGFPVSPGHSLVIPRRLIANWWEATTEEQRAIFELVDLLKRRIDVEFAPDGYNVGFNDGDAAGQTVFHLHIHVIPRYSGDVDDPRGGVRHVIPHKANYLVPTVPDEAMSGSSGSSRSTDRSRLVTAASPSDVSTETRWFKLQLLQALINDDHDQIDLLVSFVMRSGVDLIARHVDDALERGARIRLLTTDYLGITDPGALGFFLDREDLQVRVFSDPSTSFHPKAYIFRSSRSGGGTAFVGSSNLSRSGISAGVEWNIQTRSLGDLSDEFEALWNDERSVRLSADWLSNYNATRRVRRPIPPVGDGPTQDQTLVDDESPLPDSDGEWEPAPEPWSVQADALAALEATRVEGYNAGLVVMATGLGKTWLAAFDSTRTEVERVLFVAHREEILTQARDVFRQIRPTASLTMFSGSERSPNGDVVFATIQSLHRNLSRFEPAAFDYIVVDEFHHASAMSYRRALAHFRPKFMLGLTATPDRADAADLLALCADNLVYECGLVRGVNEGLLSPFTYRAIPDVASYENIPWRSGRFDAEALTAELSTVARAEQVLAEWRKLTETDPEGAGTGANPSAARSLGTARSLGFCCTIAHADFMAEQFRKHDVAAVAVHSGAGSAPRAESIERLGAGEIDIIFTVDLFNEGIDIPNVDSVFMLRPTESPVVFYQQLGRGLRRAEGKERLEVIDLVGNHRSFLLKARLLAELAGRSHLTNREALEYLAAARSDLADGSVALPEGCSIIVDPEVVDLLGRIARPGRERDRMVDLVRQWADDHDGRRPSALEVALVTGKPLELRSDGGWFGFLARLGVLTNFEANVRESVPGFFEWIEHGSYTKSYKLVTLRALVRSGSLIGAMPLDELAAECMADIMGDPDLREDLMDATGSFADVNAPTAPEWLAYWRKNPIKAITTASKSQAPWFALGGDGRVVSMLSVDEDLVATLESMTLELVDCRLHRYLVQQATKRVGERRKFRDDNGVEIDATFVVESRHGRPTAVVMESAGGTRGSKNARNLDYVGGVDLALKRLRQLDVHVADAYVDLTRTKDLPLSQRRLTVDGLSYPIDLAEIGDIERLRKNLLQSITKVGQEPGATGGGNARKRVKLVIAGDGWSAAGLADALAGG